MKIFKQLFVTLLVLVALCCSMLVTLGMRPSSTPMALIMKVVPEVVKKTANTDWTSAVASDQLQGGDQVKTAKKALAILKFMDKSIVRVHEQSQVILNADASGPRFTKVVDLNGGVFGFDIKKQTDERYRFTSPTSVASIRGTTGKFTDHSQNDTLVVVEGLVNLKNNVSNKDIDVAAGFIGFSGRDGLLSSRHATPEELADASNAAIGNGGKELNIEMRDSKGNKKNLKIKIKQ